MVQLELVDWEEIFQQIRVWCTFNPFIVYLFSSFTLFQQKLYTGRGPKRVKSLALVIGFFSLSLPMSILHNNVTIHNSSCKMNVTSGLIHPSITPNTNPSKLNALFIHTDHLNIQCTTSKYLKYQVENVINITQHNTTQHKF